MTFRATYLRICAILLAFLFTTSLSYAALTNESDTNPSGGERFPSLNAGFDMSLTGFRDKSDQQKIPDDLLNLSDSFVKERTKYVRCVPYKGIMGNMPPKLIKILSSQGVAVTSKPGSGAAVFCEVVSPYTVRVKVGGNVVKQCPVFYKKVASKFELPTLKCPTASVTMLENTGVFCWNERRADTCEYKVASTGNIVTDTTSDTKPHIPNAAVDTGYAKKEFLTVNSTPISTTEESYNAVPEVKPYETSFSSVKQTDFGPKLTPVQRDAFAGNISQNQVIPETNMFWSKTIGPDRISNRLNLTNKTLDSKPNQNIKVAEDFAPKLDYFPFMSDNFTNLAKDGRIINPISQTRPFADIKETKSRDLSNSNIRVRINPNPDVLKLSDNKFIQDVTPDFKYEDVFLEKVAASYELNQALKESQKVALYTKVTTPCDELDNASRCIVKRIETANKVAREVFEKKLRASTLDESTIQYYLDIYDGKIDPKERDIPIVETFKAYKENIANETPVPSQEIDNILNSENSKTDNQSLISKIKDKFASFFDRLGI